MDNLVKSATFSWKTTLVGFGVGCIPIGQEVLNALGSNQPVQWKNVLFGLGIMFLGALAKDANKTGVK